ncbi:hypothetical protein CYY_008653 [Polysphondylium violaceum]|uniref:Uncharacterized protein n=1 Tax=Polysphondylium violaceum TaxID=133409 RepID=A0A8J4V128_9MYCE|nr:hypothetical protein CYY_008653 [Polysphondylium violaceum]
MMIKKNNIILLSVFITLCLFVFGINGVPMQCLDEQGEPVDWWVIQKQPKLTKSTGRYRAGLGYMYADENNPTLEVSYKWLNDSDTALAHTLEQVFTDHINPNLLWVMYNDQPPESKVGSDYAHSKGVVAFTDDVGFWLIHSVPRFPLDPKTTKYHYPANEVRNGQSFLCVSYNAHENFAKIAEKIYTNRAYIYSYNIPSTIGLQKTVLQKLIDGSSYNYAKTDSSDLYSLNGLKFKVFAKNTQWNNDLYESLLQPAIAQNMLISTWRLGAKTTIMPTFCQPNYTYDSVNVEELSIPGGSEFQWRYTKDHSKWAISLDQERNYVCIGDINRMYSQYKRGGGSACFVNDKLWNSYYNMIYDTSLCSTK